MEFKTTTGGETTLVFDGSEQMVISQLAKRRHLAEDAVVRMLTTARQANPLADFGELVILAYPSEGAGTGVVPTRTKKAPPVDPTLELEQQIRRRLSAHAGAVGTTSQSQQAEALLLQALAVCLQTRMLCEMLERLDKPPLMVAGGDMRGHS